MFNKLLSSIVVFALCYFSESLAQQRDFHTTEGMDCSQCHECKKPTKKNPCLRICPRPFGDKDGGIKISFQEVDDYIIMSELEEIYDPVVFSHKLHASMSDMSDGCVYCHHFTPTNQSHPPCKECHDANILHEDKKQPCLKAAYHRQCISCHQNWSGETNCDKCHIMKEKKAAAGEKYIQPKYKKCNEPEKRVYETSYEKGPMVTFFHNNHAKLYCLGCSDCHKEDPCVRCHYQQEKPLSVIEEEEDIMHHKCSACHDVDSKNNCKECHFKQENKGFDHQRVTGWALNIFHKQISCHSCHPKGKRISKLDKTCINCHNNWNQDNFEHAKVGIDLDENHIEAECSDCHPNNQYDKQPVCSDCHDEEITYPADKPGEATKKGK